MQTSKRFHFMILILIQVVTVGWCSADDRRPNKSILKIMTFNAEFLWDGIAPEEGQVNFAWKNSETEANEHMEEIAEVIRTHNPDIVHLVETEGKPAVEKLNQDHLGGLGYKVYFIKGKDIYTGQDVALLSRIDPEDYNRYDGKGQAGDIRKSVSKNIYAKFQIGNQKIAIIGLHFLSRPNAENRRAQREAQADAIKQIALQLHSQGYTLVILGDYNDYDGDLDCLDHIDSTPITNVLRIIKELDPATTLDDLFNVTELIPKASRYTAFWDKDDDDWVDHPGELTSIDHILVSKSIRAKVDYAEIPHSHDPVEVSDHFPVLVKLRTDDQSQPSGLRIISLIPNPPGSDAQNEEVTIKNFSASPINLNGWKLRDEGQKTWALSSLGVIQPGEEKTIKRNGQAMSLNNDGDTIYLIDPNGNIVHIVTYGPVVEGEIVEVN